MPQGSNTDRLTHSAVPDKSPFLEFNLFINAAEVSGLLILA
jgi:hypothetical protein